MAFSFGSRLFFLHLPIGRTRRDSNVNENSYEKRLVKYDEKYTNLKIRGTKKKKMKSGTYFEKMKLTSPKQIG